MPFKAILQRLVESTGATGAVLMASDGEVVEAYSSSQAELELIGAHQGIILAGIKEAAARTASPVVRSAVITTDKARLFMLTVKDGYYVVVTTPRAQYDSRVIAEGLIAVSAIEADMG